MPRRYLLYPSQTKRNKRASSACSVLKREALCWCQHHSVRCNTLRCALTSGPWRIQSIDCAVSNSNAPPLTSLQNLIVSRLHGSALVTPLLSRRAVCFLKCIRFSRYCGQGHERVGRMKMLQAAPNRRIAVRLCPTPGTLHLVTFTRCCSSTMYIEEPYFLLISYSSA